MLGCHLGEPLSIEAKVIHKDYICCIDIPCSVLAAFNASPQMPGPCMRCCCKWHAFLTIWQNAWDNDGLGVYVLLHKKLSIVSVTIVSVHILNSMASMLCTE